LEEEEFKRVRTFIRENPGATIIETAEGTGVDEQKIFRFLREGRLISQGLQSSASLRCERCGQPVSEGRYCRSCKAELESELKESLSDISARQRASNRDRERMFIMEQKPNKKGNR